MVSFVIVAPIIVMSSLYFEGYDVSRVITTSYSGKWGAIYFVLLNLSGVNVTQCQESWSIAIASSTPRHQKVFGRATYAFSCPYLSQ